MAIIESAPICLYCGSGDTGWWNKKLQRGVCRSCGRTFSTRPTSDSPPKLASAVATQVIKIPIDSLMIALFDAHLDPTQSLHPAFSVAKQMTLDLKPNYVVFGGDWLELASLSAWDRDKRALMAGKRYRAEIDYGYDHIYHIRKALPDATMFFLEGNHEFRLPRYLEYHPEVEGMLDIKNDLHLDDSGIQWVPFNEVIKVGKLNILHGVFYNVYFARSTLNAIGESCLFGHSHKSQTYVQRLHNNKRPNIAQGVGCLCTTDPQWKRGTPTNFVNSFAIVEFRAKGLFNIFETLIVDGGASYGGSTWVE